MDGIYPMSDGTECSTEEEQQNCLLNKGQSKADWLLIASFFVVIWHQVETRTEAELAGQLPLSKLNIF